MRHATTREGEEQKESGGREQAQGKRERVASSLRGSVRSVIDNFPFDFKNTNKYEATPQGTHGAATATATAIATGLSFLMLTQGAGGSGQGGRLS